MENCNKIKGVSLFSGAGGLDVGFVRAGAKVLWANDINKDACETYRLNLGEHIHCGDLNSFLSDLKNIGDIDVVFGGPPCQGFSVAGKMNPDDPRSQLILKFAEVVSVLQPRAFVMENVKALGKLAKWEPIKNKLLQMFKKNGYSVHYIVLNASDFNVPQARERVFFVGFKGNPKMVPCLENMLMPYIRVSDTSRKALSVLDKAGTGNNKSVCKAKITLASKPILRKSPYAGMIFNGLGRPIKLDGYCATLPASMGGNKTPIIDENELYNQRPAWIIDYHDGLINGEITPEIKQVPPILRRLTVQEAAVLQTFPLDFKFSGSQSSIYSQIGNAVPCNLAESVARMVIDVLESKSSIIYDNL